MSLRPLYVLLAVLVAAPAVAQEEDRAESSVTQTYLVRSKEDAGSELPIVVQGTIVDGETGNMLDYTNIFVEGTDYGTMALNGGRFWLRGLLPGQYTIKARYLGFDEGVAEIEVRAGDVLDIRMVLELKPVLLDALQVRAQRQLIVLQETGTARRVGSDEIENLALDDVEEIVSLQAGVVKEDNTIHIRGGRAADTQFYVDGVSVNDPLSAGRYGASFNEDLINEIEVLTGGFSAEYGQATTGVVKVSTKEGGPEYEGKLTYKTDRVAPADIDYDTDQMRLTLSGPNPLWQGLKKGLSLPGEQYWIASFSGNLTNTYLPTQSLNGPLQSEIVDDFWSPRADNDWSAVGKLTWKFDTQRKLNLTHNYQHYVGQGYFLPAEGYPNKFRNILDDYDVFSLQSIQSQANWKHVLGVDSFYEVTLGRQFTRQNSHQNGEPDFRNYAGPIVNELEDQAGTTYVEGAFLGGDNERWHDHYADIYSLKADWAWAGDENNRFKAGFQYSYNEIQLGDYQDGFASIQPGRVANSEDVFRATPHLAAAYVQDRFSYKGLILNLGLRWDGWAPGPEVDEAIENADEYIFVFDADVESYNSNTTDLFGLRWKQRLSPRVGLSFPISNKDKFFFNYGHFSQWPRWNYVYSQLETDFTTQLRLIGNPDLDPKVTVQYETGIQREFPGRWTAGVTFYSNDIYGYAQAVRLDGVTILPEQTPDPDDDEPVTISPVRYFNADAARSLGVELSVEKRATKFVSGRFNLEFSRATGTNSDANAGFLAAQLEEGGGSSETEEGVRSNPLTWDRPWSVTANVNVRADAGQSPKVFGWQTPQNWNLNLLYRAWSGVRYTRVFLIEDSQGLRVETDRNENTEIGPYRSSLDVALRKWWDLPLGQTFTIFMEAQNVLDHQNYRRINPWTGDGYFVGNWDGAVVQDRASISEQISSSTETYAEDAINPSHRSDPRRLLMGVSLEW